MKSFPSNASENLWYFSNVCFFFKLWVKKLIRLVFAGVGENIAGLSCVSHIADLVIDHGELERSAHLVDRRLYYLQCAMEENCLSSEAYRIQKESRDWHLEARRLLVFTARILNAGTADFRPFVPKHLWEWHMCHRSVIFSKYFFYFILPHFSFPRATRALAHRVLYEPHTYIDTYI